MRNHFCVENVLPENDDKNNIVKKNRRENGDDSRDNVFKKEKLSTNLSNEDIAKENLEKKLQRLNLYERLSFERTHDQRILKEIILGQRIGFYRLKEEIGEGNFGKVRLGIHLLTHNKVAVKILDKFKMQLKVKKLLSKEVPCMENLHHPNIIRFYEVIETLSKIFIIMEYACNGELQRKVCCEGKLAESVAKIYFAQIISAVQHMHQKNVIHRDLKAENIYLSSNNCIKIGDFGFSNYCNPEEFLNTFCGSPPYAAPELFADKEFKGHYVDIWAMGVVLYFMVVGHLPFRAETVGKLKKLIKEGCVKIPDHVTRDCAYVITSILRVEPTERLLLKQMEASNWLTGCTFPEPFQGPLNIESIPRDMETAPEEHKETRKKLKTLGISDEKIENSLNRQTRSSITGTYQIVLHQIQKENSKNLDTFEYQMINCRAKPVIDMYVNKSSRLCSIL